MKKIILLIFLISCFAFRVSTVDAQYGQPSPSYTIIVDKLVGKYTAAKGANDVEYVDNLTPSDSRFAPSQDVWFKIKVRNTSRVILNNVLIKDSLPNYVEPVQGAGSFDAATRIISINVGDLGIDEEKAFFIKTKILAQNQLPADRGLFCLTNRVDVTSNQASSLDTSQFCIEKKVTPPPQVPSAGPEMGLMLLTFEGMLLTTGIIALKLGKKITYKK